MSRYLLIRSRLARLAMATACLAACADLAHAQRRHTFSGFAQGLSVDQVPSIAWKRSGDQTSSPEEFPDFGASSVPLFRTEALFGNASIDIDAMSTGNDLVPVKLDVVANHFIVRPPESAPGEFSWASMIVSTKGGDSTAGSTGTFAERQAGALTNEGGDLFSYWFENNAGVPAENIDRSYFVAGHEHSGLPAGTEVRALDSYIPLIIEARAEPSTYLPVTSKWFFSLTPESAERVRTQWTDEGYADRFDMDSSEVTASTVFVAVWNDLTDPNPGFHWGPIRVFAQYDDMGLDLTDNLDALAVYDRSPFNDYVVFSLEGSVPDTQIRVSFLDDTANQGWPIATPAHYPLFTPSGDTVESRIGIPPIGDIDAICAWDPEHDDLDPWVGTPIGESELVSGVGGSGSTSPAVVDPLGLSVTRFRAANGEHVIRAFAADLPFENGTIHWAITTHGNTVTTPPGLTRFSPVASRLLRMGPGDPGTDVMRIVAYYTPPEGQPGPVRASSPVEIWF